MNDRMIKAKKSFLTLLITTCLILATTFVTTISAGADITVPGDHETIQAAIDAANAGDTIIVSDGTYAENLVIDKVLTLKSENGSATVCDVTIGGTDVGFTIIAPNTGNQYGIEIGLNCDRATIQDNIISGAVQVGIHIWGVDNGEPNAHEDIVIEDNTITSTLTEPAGECYGIITAPITEGTLNLFGDACLIDGNDISGFSGCAIYLYNIDGGTTNPIVISNNILYDNTRHGLVVIGSEVSITGNTIYDNTLNGITIAVEETTNIDVEENDIYSNTEWGIMIYSGIAETITVQYNNIYSNTLGGLSNGDTGICPATLNYWGDVSGPYHSTTNPYGEGDTVSNNVDYSLWLGVTYGTSPMTYCTNDNIQEGINTATAGDTIIVSDGTYTENVAVTKSLTLVGNVTDPSLVTVKSTMNVAAFTVTADDVEISGFTMTGPDSADVSLAGVYLNIVNGCTISDNVVTDSSHGFWLVGSDFNEFTDNVVSDNNQGFSIEESDYNTFTDNIADRSGKYGFYIQSSSSNEFIGNEANENTKHGFYLTINDETIAGSDSNTFTNNIANLNVQYGLRIVGGTSNTLTSNTFDNNTLGGLQLEGKTEVGYTVPLLALTLNNNAITNNPTGIQIEATTSNVEGSDITTWEITYNDIVGNDDFGIKNLGTGTLDAANNYWGHASGPYHDPTNPIGQGNSVSDNVEYYPWLLEAGGVIYDLTIPLSIGWNLISTPKILNNSFTDLSTIIPSNLQLAYRYNPTTGWASTNTMPGPLEAIFVRMSEYGGIGFKWTNDPQTAPPARYLSANWSLIGPNMEGDEFDEGLTVDVLLNNINATTQGYQIVHSPGYNSASWTVTYLNSGSQSMLPFRGYWVFMNSGMTLAGRNI